MNESKLLEAIRKCDEYAKEHIPHEGMGPGEHCTAEIARENLLEIKELLEQAMWMKA